MSWGLNSTIIVILVGAWLFPALCPAEDSSHSPSVYEIHPVRDGVIIGATAILDLYPALNGYNFIYIKPAVHSDELIPWDRQAIGNRNIFLDNLSNATVATTVAGLPLLDLLDVGWHHELVEDLTVFAETLTINSALTELFKYTTQRPIPRVYAGTDTEDTKGHRGYEAFYSGHVSTTVAALSAASFTLGLRYSQWVWPWIVTAAIGTTVAYERVEAGQHFPTGVLAGGIMGAAVGVLVPLLHRREPPGTPTITLVPVSGGAALNWKLRF